jgi:formyltetrahydrofolate-dependent phosphoribosylglycinamide formyltransferase
MSVSRPINLAVLISGSGTTLQNLIERIGDKSLNARISTVVASRAGIKGIDRAEAASLPCHVVDKKTSGSVGEFSRGVFDICREAKAELIVLAGWLCLLEIPREFGGRIMNIHPALLPKFGGKGMYGHHVHEAVIAAKCAVSGCTVHFVDGTYDTGPIILQRTCAVMDGDTADALAARVFEEEKIAYPEAIRLFQEGKLRIEGKAVRAVGR